MATKILVVDDEAKILKLLVALLEARGYEVSTASDGEEALRKVQAETPDLMVVDLMLPAMDGWRIAKRLKTDARYQHIPLIMLSALVAEDSPKEAFEQGDFFMSKPFDADKLLAKVREFLEKAQPGSK